MKSEKLMYVGCGNHRLKYFDHVEINVMKQFKNKGNVGTPEIIADITKKIPVQDNSYHMVFSRATLEHLTYPELINHLLECHRIIAPSGVIRMSVPDFDIMIKNYIEKSEDLEIAISESEIDPNLPIENHTDLFVSRVLYHDHYYLHNFDTLSRALKKCGFSNIRRATPGDTIIASARSQLSEAESGRQKFEVIIEAQKLNEKPKIQAYQTKNNKNFILEKLSEFFNINVIKYHNRKPAFPNRYWFYEKYNLIRSIINRV